MTDTEFAKQLLTIYQQIDAIEQHRKALGGQIADLQIQIRKLTVEKATGQTDLFDDDASRTQLRKEIDAFVHNGSLSGGEWTSEPVDDAPIADAAGRYPDGPKRRKTKTSTRKRRPGLDPAAVRFSD